MVVQQESVRRDRGTRSTLSKPQIYDVGGRERERDHSSGLESQRRRNRIRRHEPLFSFLLSIRSATRHAPSYIPFFSAYTGLSVYITVRSAHITRVQQQRERKHRPSPSNSPFFRRFYSLRYAYAGFYDAIRVLIATIPQKC